MVVGARPGRRAFSCGGGAPGDFAGGGGVMKMAASAASTKNLLCQKAANSKFNPRLKINLMQRQAMQRSSSNDQQT
jgi:hypothetical protein